MRQELTQEIENTARAIVNEVHTALPGEIVSFNASNGTVTVKPIGRFTTSNKKVLEYPSISEVPLVFPYCQQAGVGIAFPVFKGDSCLIIISEVELDEWRSGAESEGSLRFDLTNAIAIPGLMNGGVDLVMKATEKNAVVIGTTGAEICISDESVDIAIDEVTFSVSESGIAIGGDLLVKGNISYTGDNTKVILEENESQTEEV